MLRDVIARQSRQIAMVEQGIALINKRREQEDRKIELLKLAGSFRKAVEMASVTVVPFKYLFDILVIANDASIFSQILQTSTKGWFFAERVSASLVSTSGATGGQWRPLTHNDPVVSVYDAGQGADVEQVFDFSWGYRETRTQMARQNDSRLIPGDLLFRRDGDGFLLGGDPWAPNSAFTFLVKPTVALSGSATMRFTIDGALCVGTKESALKAWIEQRNRIGF